MQVTVSCLMIFVALAFPSPLHSATDNLSIPPHFNHLKSHIGRDVAAEAGQPTGLDILSDALSTAPRKDIVNQPLGNAPLWQEALANDAKIGGGNTNQLFYQTIAYFQSQENSSHSLDMSKSSSQADALSTSSLIAQGLQHLHVYPAQWDQAQADHPAQSIIEISSIPQQTIKSFGASGAWWPNYLKDFPLAQQQNLSRLLFSEDGLQLSGYRYNMGASGEADNVKVTTPGRAVESFMTSNGSYDWTRDSTGIQFLRAAQEAGVPDITFFVNAIPAALTTTKAPCGLDLSPDWIEPFVAYITKVLSHWTENGIKIDYISPMNEPQNSFSECTQEGMTVPHTLRASIFQLLRTSLQNTTTKIMGDETSQIASQAMTEYPTWFPPTVQSNAIDALAVHMYDWPDDATLLNYRQLVINASLPAPPPPIRMTEISTFRTATGVHKPWGWTGPNIMGAEYDPTIDSALDMARMIWQWLTLVNAESWDWWTAVSTMMPCSPTLVPGCANTFSNSTNPPGFNDGLVYIARGYKQTGDYTFYLVKRYWVFRHFTKFFRPGTVRYDVPNEILPYGTVAVAGRAVGGRGLDATWSITFVNRNATAQSVKLRVPEPGAEVIEVVQTTQEDDWAVLPLPRVGADGIVGVTLPARGVLTVRFATERAAVAPTGRRKRGGGKGGRGGRRVGRGEGGRGGVGDGGFEGKKVRPLGW